MAHSICDHETEYTIGTTTYKVSCVMNEEMHEDILEKLKRVIQSRAKQTSGADILLLDKADTAS